MAAPSKTIKIGKYDVVDTIGRGGMGVVYLAKDPYLDRLVAIKMMNIDAHESGDFLERFYREAKSTASLQHHNIVTVYELGEHQGRPFLVMQYLEGHSLEALLRSHQPMSLLEKIGIIVEVCQGLGYAHQRGIVHRDIKPANIMVLHDGGVKIVDFGIARLGDNTLTRTGQIVGTLSYMPPEQFRDVPLDTRADIYSTGIVLYQLLTNSLPFQGESTGSTLAKIISDDPPPFRQFGVSCPVELEAITLKALAKNRDERYPVAEAFAVALAEVQDRLRQETITEYLGKAELLQQDNELVQAQDYLVKVLKLDRQHTNAARLLSTVRAKLQAQLSTERLQQLKQQAEDTYARGDFEASLAFVNQAIEIDRGPDLQALRSKIEKGQVEAELVRNAVARAEASQRSGDLEAAKTAIEDAFSRSPNDSKIKALRRAIERDLEERDRQKKVEGLLDQVRKQMSARKFTAALDLLKEAQGVDPSAPQLRVLLERLATEHQQEKRRRELERLSRELQEAIDQDDYPGASAKAAEALNSFPGDHNLLRLKELADAQIALVAQKEFVRSQIAAAEEALDGGQTQSALALVESALQRAPGNTRLESFRAVLLDRLTKDLAEADKATCIGHANEAVSLRRYDDAIRILKSAQLRFAGSSDVDDLLHLVRDQQAKAKRQALVDEAMRTAKELLAEKHCDEAIQLLEKTAEQQPGEDLEILLKEARSQRDASRRDLQAVVAKGQMLLAKGEAANAVEFLTSRLGTHKESEEFCALLEEARAASAAGSRIDLGISDATRILAPPEQDREGVTRVQQIPSIGAHPTVIPEPVPLKQSLWPEEEPPRPRKTTALIIGAVVLTIVLAAALIVWWRARPGYLDVQSNVGAEIRVDGTARGRVPADGILPVKVTPGSHRIEVTLENYTSPEAKVVTVAAGGRVRIIATATELPPPPPPPPPPAVKLGTLVLRTNVADADVFLNGQLKGTTGRDNKLELQVDPGKYKLQVKRPGYQDSSEQSIEITANKEKPVTLNLAKSESVQQRTPADTYLIIQSLPGAEVRVDGVVSGKVTSGGTLPVRVDPGARQVQVTLEGYQAWSNAETVAAGGRKNIQAPLKQNVVTPTPPPPVTGEFSASRTTIEEGETTRLSWTTQNATEVSINPSISGGVIPSSGGHDVSPRETTTYTLTAKGNGGTYTAKLEIVVQPKPPPPPPPPPKKDESDRERMGGSAWASAVDISEIRELLTEFERAYGGMTIQDFGKIWPNMPEPRRKAILKQFDTTKAIIVEEHCDGQPTFTSASTAEWVCKETKTFRPSGGGDRQHSDHREFFKFTKKNGQWVIDNQTLAD